MLLKNTKVQNQAYCKHSGIQAGSGKNEKVTYRRTFCQLLIPILKALPVNFACLQCEHTNSNVQIENGHKFILVQPHTNKADLHYEDTTMQADNPLWDYQLSSSPSWGNRLREKMLVNMFACRFQRRHHEKHNTHTKQNQCFHLDTFMRTTTAIATTQKKTLISGMEKSFAIGFSHFDRKYVEKLIYLYICLRI